MTDQSSWHGRRPASEDHIVNDLMAANHRLREEAIAERDRLQAENERLRTALQRIAAIEVEPVVLITPQNARLSNAVAIATGALGPAFDDSEVTG